MANPNLFSAAFREGELMDMRDSFFGLTGLDIAFVDRNGMPVVSPGGFFSCSGRCLELNSEIARILLYKICCSPAMLIRLSLIVGDVA